MIDVLVTSFDKEMPDPLFERHLASLPAEMRASICRYKRWQDRQRALLAKLLLRAGLENLGFQESVMGLIGHDDYGRPYLEEEIDFNISHSGKFIICAITMGKRVGIDIEAVRPVELNDFTPAFYPEQLREMSVSEDPYGAFFSSWTRKESASKADGRGMSIPFRDIILEEGIARINDVEWKLAPISLHPDYYCHLATDELKGITVKDFYWQGT